MLWREPFTGKNLVLVQISKRSLKKYRQSEDNWTYEVSEWGPRNDILGDTMSSNNAFGVTTIYLRFSHGRSHHHGDPLRKCDDLIKNNRTRPFPSVQQPQQLGNVTTYSKLIWPLIWFWLGRKSLSEPQMSQRKVNLVRINFKSATELRLVRLEEYLWVSCQGAGTHPH